MSQRGNVRFKSNFYKTYIPQFVDLGGVSPFHNLHVLNILSSHLTHCSTFDLPKNGMIKFPGQFLLSLSSSFPIMDL